MQELISEKWSILPDISDNGYKVGEFIINNLRDIKHLRYGCVYQDKNDTFLLLKEENVDVSELEFIEDCDVENTKIYYGYIPQFIIAKKMIEKSRTYISWRMENSLFTLIQTNSHIDSNILSLSDMTQNEKMMKIFKNIIHTDKSFGHLAYFRMIENMPREIQEFKLVTLYTTFSYIEQDTKEIMIVLKGNFIHETDTNVFVNLEMGFSYAFSEKFNEFSQNFKKENEIYESKNYDEIIEYSYINPDEKFYVKCNNNETSIEFKDNIQTIIAKVVENMKEYSCVEETLILGQSRR
ncbi:MAG: hypothetical protein K0B07_01945 [DPANN group archaeon]|nr:hypothetical protein [DPANN group archaeon]